MGFKILEDQDSSPKNYEVKVISDLHKYIDEHITHQPVLVYCTDEQKENLNQDNRFQKKVSNEEILDDEVMQHLQRKYDGAYLLLIATEDKYMRAIDYRAPDTGIALVIARPFNHSRQSLQGLGRVGRNGDKCNRVRLANVELVDKEKEIIYQSNLMVYFSNNIARKIYPVSFTKGGQRPLKIAPNQQKLTNMLGKRDTLDKPQPRVNTRA